MAIDHEMHRARIKDYSAKSGHPVEYNDGGTTKLESNLKNIRTETARRKEVQKTLRNASDEEYDRARAIVEGRMKR